MTKKFRNEKNCLNNKKVRNKRTKKMFKQQKVRNEHRTKKTDVKMTKKSTADDELKMRKQKKIQKNHEKIIL